MSDDAHTELACALASLTVKRLAYVRAHKELLDSTERIGQRLRNDLKLKCSTVVQLHNVVREEGCDVYWHDLSAVLVHFEQVVRAPSDAARAERWKEFQTYASAHGVNLAELEHQ